MTTGDIPQHLRALARANEVRLARAELKHRVGSGEVAVAEVIDPAGEIPREVESMPVMDLLCAQPRWGRRRARKVLVPLSIGELRPLGSLTHRQRGQLHAALSTAGMVDARLLAA